MKVLVTGGAGFIGSYVCEGLLKQGWEVIAYDNLDPQVHGADASWPEYLPAEVERWRGDVRDRELLRKALGQSDAVIHLAAAVGVGQSMYEIAHYCSVNVMGTAVLLEEMLPLRDRFRKLLVASSMSIYGEGAYRNRRGEVVYPSPRRVEQLKTGEWELRDADGDRLEPIPTPEDKPLRPESIYAVTKRDQEEMCLAFGKAYGVPTAVMRKFNVFGPRQALSNPYTGVAAIFSSKLLKNEPPFVFEDGNQMRDFVYVEDVAEAYTRALENDSKEGAVYNLGSGKRMSVTSIARGLAEVLGKEIEPFISQEYRDGDIRHCFGDIRRICSELDWKPAWTFQDGLVRMLEWLVRQDEFIGHKDSVAELREMGLLK